MQSDSLFYQIFRKSPHVFFELVGSEPIHVGLYRFISQEVKPLSRSTHNVVGNLKLKDKGRTIIEDWFVAIRIL
jgi:predicted transposase YdaD